MDDKKEDGKDKFDKMFFSSSYVIRSGFRGRKKKFLQIMKEIEEEPNGNGGD